MYESDATVFCCAQVYEDAAGFEGLGMHMKLKKPSVLGNVTFTYASRPDEPVLRGQALEWGKCTNKASTWRFLRVRPPHW